MSRDRGLDNSQAEKDDGKAQERPAIGIQDAYGAPPSKPTREAAKVQPGQEVCLKPAVALPLRVGEEARTAGRLPSEAKPTLNCMRVSDQGLKVIQYYEGLKLQPYTDMGGKQAIGYGHHIRAGEDFSSGINKTRADTLLLRDLRVARFHVADKVAVPLSQGQYDALVSFVFNVGCTNFARSTLLKKLNSGDYDGAADEFQRWNRAGRPSKVLRGLSRRREAERVLFTSL